MIRTRSVSLARSIIGLTLGASVLSSCAKVDNMYDATMGMAETTESMKRTTCTMYRSMRQGNSKLSRSDDLEAISRAKNINEKLAIAAEYMQGFEYQVWSPVCADEPPRDLAVEQGMRELLVKIQTYVSDRSEVGATKRSSDYETLYAISATLHYTNSLQAGLLAHTTEQVMRPVDYLVEGLRYDQKKNRGQLAEAQLPSWAVVVGKYEKDAEFLLRLRANFLMAYAYAIADSDDFGNTPNLLEKAYRVVATKLLNKKWTPNLAKRSPTEIRERITVALNLANETRAALVSLGIDPMVDETIAEVWKNADLSGFNLEKMEKRGGEEQARAIAIRELMQARSDMLSRLPRR